MPHLSVLAGHTDCPRGLHERIDELKQAVAAARDGGGIPAPIEVAEILELDRLDLDAERLTTVLRTVEQQLFDEEGKMIGGFTSEPGLNLVVPKPAATRPPELTARAFPAVWSETDILTEIARIEDTERLLLRCYGQGFVSGQKAWVALLNAPPAGGEHFSTQPGDARDSSGNVAHTDGLRGIRTVLGDGTVVIDATERIFADYDGTDYGPATARQLRTTKNKATTVQQREGYCWRLRDLQDATLQEGHAGFGAASHESGRATRFGKNDSQDSGASTPTYKIVQTCSEVFGVSLKSARMAAALGANWTCDPRRLTAMVEVYNPTNDRFARVPLVEVGPGNPDAAIDLTWALDEFLQTNGSAQVDYRLLI